MKSPENNYPYIAISGPIGIGKTTVAKIVAADLGFHLMEENFEDNPFLAGATADPDRYAFQSEVFFLMEKYKQILAAEQLRRKNGVVQDTPVQQDVYSYGKAQLKDADWSTFESLYNALAQQLMKPSLIVCLEADIAVNMERIMKRGRDFEKNLQADYLIQLTVLNHEWIAQADIPTVFIQTDHMNIVSDAEAKDRMMMQVRTALK